MSNAQKTPLARSLNRFAEGKVLDEIQRQGKSLPCRVTKVSGSIVTVKFEIQTPYDLTLPEVTCPMFGPEYIRYPIQVDDLGAVMSIDVYLGGVSGLGSEGSVADLTQRSNLSSLIFFPIANKNWSETDNPNALVLYGPDGAVIRTVDKNTKLTLNKDDGVAIVTDKKFTVSADAESTVTADGETLTVGSGSIKSSGVLKAGNGATHSATISGHFIEVKDGIVTAFT